MERGFVTVSSHDPVAGDPFNGLQDTEPSKPSRNQGNKGRIATSGATLRRPA